MATQWIIVDWGTSNFRAWLIDADSGMIRDEISDGAGMASLESREFPDYCRDRLQAWRTGSTPPIYMSGMVGAAQGWQLAPQLPLPIRLDELAKEVVAANGLDDTWIIPGARLAGDHPDVMRGEEVQIFGALAIAGRDDALLCLPGTHSKWARVEDRRLNAFTTSMTGEVFELMLSHSILARSAEERKSSEAAFEQGLIQAQNDGGLLHQLFTTRARTLYGGLAPADLYSYLSGVLIGSEVKAMQTLYPPDGQELLLICASGLRQPYEHALRLSGYSTRWLDARLASLQGTRAIIARHRSD
ncbi:MAG: 2-dehydro-3-deoxygalactonokinase [Gammaproteobacteria bacterium]|nr:2-dehydro-3-deoxygalactonokinase [Gammaproteobacteria bacterium]